MEFPESIIIQFNKIDGNPINDLIVSIVILANKKNNYNINFLKTDSSGKINLFKSEIENIIENSMRESIMDYSSTIDNCKDLIVIKVEDVSKLNSRIKRIEKYYPEKAKLLKQLTKECSNKLFNPLELQHKIESEIKIQVF